MSNSGNRKLKLLHLMRMLTESTDEEHALTVPEMIEGLGAYGIAAERKSVYDDLSALSAFGLDIERSRARSGGYFIASRTFELPELKLLADAVASSRFITEKKSSELIKKIESLTSVHEARQLRRQVYVMGRVKTMNEKIYYNVDAIHQAVAKNRQITFRYFDYGLDRTKRYRRGGEAYRASPYALTWDSENYYMIAYYETYGGLSHFRVDKMEGIEMAEEPRVVPPDRKAFNLAEYSRKVFGMFGGEERRIRLQFDNSLIGVVLDRFGPEAAVRREDESSFTVSADAIVGPTLLGWLFSFGDRVKILGPESLAELFRENAQACLRRYEREHEQL